MPINTCPLGKTICNLSVPNSLVCTLIFFVSFSFQIMKIKLKKALSQILLPRYSLPLYQKQNKKATKSIPTFNTNEFPN